MAKIILLNGKSNVRRIIHNSTGKIAFFVGPFKNFSRVIENCQGNFCSIGKICSSYSIFWCDFFV